MKKLDGRVVIVTVSGMGVLLQYCLRGRRKGVVTGRNEERAKAVVDQIRVKAMKQYM